MAQSTAPANRTINMTHGRSVPLILRFALPLIAINMMQQMYSIFDAAILGHYNGIGGLAVLGTCAWPIWLPVSLATNFSQGAAILVSHSFGAGDKEKIRSCVGTVLLFTILLWIVMQAGFLLLARKMLVVQNTPADVIDQAEKYLVICYSGFCFLFAYNICSAFLRSVGDSKTPLIAISVATSVKVLLDILLVVRFQMGVTGVAIGTVVAQGTSAVLCLIRVLRCELFHLKRRHLKADRKILREYLRLSLPLLLQSVVIAAGGFYVQSSINQYGTAFAAGISASVKLYCLLETVAVALAQSAATFVGQNYGALRFDRINTGINRTVQLSMLAAFVLAGGMYLFGGRLLSFYVAQEAYNTAWEMLIVMSTGLLLMNPMYVLRQSIQALGNTMIPLAAAIVQLLARFLTTKYLPMVIGSRGMYFPSLVAWATSLIMIGIALPIQIKKGEEKAGYLTDTHTDFIDG